LEGSYGVIRSAAAIESHILYSPLIANDKDACTAPFRFDEVHLTKKPFFFKRALMDHGGLIGFLDISKWITL
jgi:hypothetical protein